MSNSKIYRALAGSALLVSLSVTRDVRPCERPTPNAFDAEPRAAAAAVMAVKWIWDEMVTEEDKAHIKTYVSQAAKSVGRKIVEKAAATLTIHVGEKDKDGDGDVDYMIHGELDDMDGDGRAEVTDNEDADDEAELAADLGTLVGKVDTWLDAHER